MILNNIHKESQRAFALAAAARNAGKDPKPTVEIHPATTLAERVVGLIAVVAPQLKESNIVARIEELEAQFGKLDWRVACIVSHEVAEQKFCSFPSKEEAIETAIRVGFAYVTVGVVSAPIEGFTKLSLKKTQQGEEYFAMYFAGPIRNAGGTGAAVSVLIADYIRKKMGYAPYDPTAEEMERCYVEIRDYHEQVTNLQYMPAKEELLTLIIGCPIQIEGEPTEQIDVSNFRNLPRISTNRIRGGCCLMLTACLCLKAPKLWKQLAQWGVDLDMTHWKFLEQVISYQKKKKAGASASTGISPNITYLQELVGGRPVFAYPMRIGGFRLRYGRTRTSGYSAQAVHPAAMEITGGFLALGTQLRVERPGKACIVMSCDSIEPPIVKLENGSVVKLTTKTAKSLKKEIKEILYLGDILISYGDFLDRAHPLAPAGYCPEWWWAEVKASQHPEVRNLIPSHVFAANEKNPAQASISYELARSLGANGIPMHPAYTYYWSAVSREGIRAIHKALRTTSSGELLLVANAILKRALEDAGIEHQMPNAEHILIQQQAAAILRDLFTNEKISVAENSLTYVQEIAPYPIRDLCGTFIGARMGRPEKAKMRHSSSNGLFNTAQAQQLQDALKVMGMVQVPSVMKGSEEGTEFPGKMVLRAVHGLSVNKDGTVRYDASEAPITHVRPREIQVSAQQMVALGYTHDNAGHPLTNDNQIVALFPQDVVLPCSPASPNEQADDIFLRVSRFVDDELVRIYKQQPYYQCTSRNDLLGKLVVGLAPHTSAGIIGRIIGFSKTQTLLCHPYFHAAMRRDCDGDESSLILLMDALLNFSPSFLSKHRGATMDAPLVLTTILIPGEVDDMVFNMEYTYKYPKELYEAAGSAKMPWEVKIPLIRSILGTERQYGDFTFTHDTEDFNEGNQCSAYKLIPSMAEKVEAQMRLARSIRAVDAADVARILIETHFLKDARGNLSKYAIQSFRCTTCNTKYRRPPLAGLCTCGGKLTFTLSEKSVSKYIEPSLELARSYKMPPYLMQVLTLTKQELDSLFGVKQAQQTQLTT